MVRAATIDDAEALAAIEVAAWRAAYRGFLAPQLMDELSVGLRTDIWAATLGGEPPSGFTLVSASEDGEPRGFCSVVTPARDDDAGNRTAELAAAYVGPQHWNNGLGRGVLTVALERLREEAWQDVTLWVFLRNAQGRAFFARLGFGLDGVQDVLPAGGAKTTRMRLTLGS